MAVHCADLVGAADRLEARWVAWIGGLESWERSLVLARELDWHDLFSAGERTLADLEDEIAEIVAAWR
jgi:hypothetical protein